MDSLKPLYFLFHMLMFLIYQSFISLISAIYLNGTSPSECRHSLCWYTKGHFRIEDFQNTIDGHDMRCIYLSTSLPYYFSKCWLAYVTIFIETHLRTQLFPLTTHVLTQLSPLQPVYISIRGFPLSNSCVIRGLLILIVTYIFIQH